jgi:hypothetical protein
MARLNSSSEMTPSVFSQRYLPISFFGSFRKSTARYLRRSSALRRRNISSMICCLPSRSKTMIFPSGVAMTVESNLAKRPAIRLAQPSAVRTPVRMSGAREPCAGWPIRLAMAAPMMMRPR